MTCAARRGRYLLLGFQPQFFAPAMLCARIWRAVSSFSTSVLLT